MYLSFKCIAKKYKERIDENIRLQSITTRDALLECKHSRRIQRMTQHKLSGILTEKNMQLGDISQRSILWQKNMLQTIKENIHFGPVSPTPINSNQRLLGKSPMNVNWRWWNQTVTGSTYRIIKVETTRNDFIALYWADKQTRVASTLASTLWRSEILY